MFSLKLNPRANVKSKPAPIPAFAVNDAPDVATPQLHSFKPKAPPISTGTSSLFSSQVNTSEDSQIVEQLAKEFEEGKVDDDDLIRKRKVWQERSGETDDSSLYEEGKFKISKIESRHGGLIKMKSTKKAEKALEPKYVSKLIQSATLRDAEREIIHESKLVKDLEKEIEESGGAKPTAYVTSGYKRRLQERQQAAEQLAARESDSVPRTTTDFQRSLLTQVYAASEELNNRTISGTEESTKPPDQRGNTPEDKPSEADS